MSLQYEKVKQINPRTKDSVFGYIRLAQKLLPKDEVYYNIPDIIYHTILLFFYLEYIKCKFNEKYCKHTTGMMTLSDDKTVLVKHKKGGWFYCALDVEEIIDGIHCFRIKVMFHHS